jgi:hypothetical protein
MKRSTTARPNDVAGIAWASGPSCPSTKQLGSAPCSDSATGARSLSCGWP